MTSSLVPPPKSRLGTRGRWRTLLIGGVGGTLLWPSSPLAGWEHSSSIPAPAVLAPARPDATAPISPAMVQVGGLLGERIAAHAAGRIRQIDEEVLLAGFRQRPGSHPWIGEHVGKWLHAASLLALQPAHDGLLEKLDRVAAGLMQTQGADGYLGTYLPGKRLGRYPGAAWNGRSWHDSDWDV